MSDIDVLAVEKAVKLVLSKLKDKAGAIHVKDFEVALAAKYSSSRFMRCMHKLKDRLVEDHGLELRRKSYTDKYPVRSIGME
jgi:hypothetical protein